MNMNRKVNRARTKIFEQGNTIDMSVEKGLSLGDGIGKTVSRITEGGSVDAVSINRAFASIDIGEDKLASGVDSDEDVKQVLREEDANKDWTVHRNQASGRITISIALKK